MGLLDRLGFRGEKKYLCRHPTCHKKFYTKEDMLKHYYPAHEGSPYDPEGSRKEIEQYKVGICQAERRIALDNEKRSYEIPGVDEVHIQSKPKYLRPDKKEEGK